MNRFSFVRSFSGKLTLNLILLTVAISLFGSYIYYKVQTIVFVDNAVIAQLHDIPHVSADLQVHLHNESELVDFLDKGYITNEMFDERHAASTAAQDRLSAELHAIRDRLLGTTFDWSENAPEVARIVSGIEAVDRYRKSVHRMLGEFRDAYAANDIKKRTELGEELFLLRTEFDATSEVLDASIDRLAGHYAGIIDALLQEFLIYSFFFIIGLFTFIVFFSGMNVFQSLVSSRRILEGIREVDKGNFTFRLANIPENEMGTVYRFFNTMLDNLESLIGKLKQNVEELNRSKQETLELLEDLKRAKEGVEQEVQVQTRKLQEEQARLLASIRSLPFGFIVADSNDAIIVKNAALTAILELEKEPVSVLDIVNSLKETSSELGALINSCRKCVELKDVVELKEFSYGKKYLRVFCAPIITKDAGSPEAREERVIGYVMLVEDITEAKILERSRDEFFAVASHELRTPLTAIRGNADMILDAYADKIVDADMKGMLQDIDLSSVRLINIVNDFLEVSRLEQGKIDIKKENFDLSCVVDKVVRDMKAMVEGKGLTLAYAPPPSLPTVFADKNRTEQILLNLVGNAAKFTKEGGITVEVQPTGKFLKVRVIDTGTGISEHNQAFLFRKFQQAGEQMLARDITQSTGLGLYISKLIISSMGGTIGLEKSELGQGSTFAFTLPIADYKVVYT